MGYNTQFTGELKFKKPLNSVQLGALSKILGEDCRDHPEWGEQGLSYIDLEITRDFSGIKWDGSEKTYDLEEKVNLVIKLMQEDYPDFELEGALLAQGEDIVDIWKLVINEEGKAEKKIIPIDGETVKCPHCKKSFIHTN